MWLRSGSLLLAIMAANLGVPSSAGAATIIDDGAA